LSLAAPTEESKTPDSHVEAEERVSPLELFFDLVFVFAITQVTVLMSNDPSWRGLGQGILVLAEIWWAWAAYGWLTDNIDADETVARLAMFGAMIGMFTVALAAPEAFDRYGVLFGCAYFVVRALHIVIYAYASESIDLEQAVRRLAPGVFIGCALLVLAGTQDGALQALLWCAAIALDWSAPLISGTAGWQVHASYFAERYGLIVIIALGESIVGIGVGLSGVTLDAGLIFAAGLGVTIAAALWWAYFDVVALVAERKLSSLTGEEQNALARDSYSYLHFPIIAGIVLLALGVKKAVPHADDPLELVPAVALCGGVALYLAGHIAFRFRNVGSWNRQRTVAAATCLALIPLATNADALIALASVAAIVVALTTFEAIRYRDARERIRAGGLPGSMLGSGGQ
jgi:low temperature requirement protein LtrA